MCTNFSQFLQTFEFSTKKRSKILERPIKFKRFFFRCFFLHGLVLLDDEKVNIVRFFGVTYLSFHIKKIIPYGHLAFL